MNAGSPDAGGQPNAPSTPIILVVDDNPELLFLVAESLRTLGHYTVVTASDGVSGLQRYYESRPACVIIDVKMPGLDGYQLVRALRGDPSTRATPLVILSALVQEREQLAGLLAGADYYLLKPITPHELLAVIARVLNESVAQREDRQQRLLDAPPDDVRRGGR